jgi:hypothetical protein
MAVDSDINIKNRAEQIKNEITAGSNTATRVGSWMRDSWDSMVFKLSGYATLSGFNSLATAFSNQASSNASAHNTFTTQIAALNSGLVNKLDITSYNDRFKGKYVSLAALNTAHPTANVGDYAQVDLGTGNDVINYNWDADDSAWVQGGGAATITNSDELIEGTTNLYFTPARAKSAVIDDVGVSATTTYSSNLLTSLIAAKQNELVSGTSIKTINGVSLLGSGNISVGTITGTGIVNKIAYFDATQNIVSSNTLFFDGNKLGVGVNSIAANIRHEIDLGITSSTSGIFGLRIGGTVTNTGANSPTGILINPTIEANDGNSILSAITISPTFNALGAGNSLNTRNAINVTSGRILLTTGFPLSSGFNGAALKVSAISSGLGNNAVAIGVNLSGNTDCGLLIDQAASNDYGSVRISTSVGNLVGYAISNNIATASTVFALKTQYTSIGTNHNASILTIFKNSTGNNINSEIITSLIANTAGSEITAHRFTTIGGGATAERMRIQTGVLIGQTAIDTAFLNIAASTTSRASLRIITGVAPTSPNDGDIWNDNTNLFIRIGGVTKTFNLT